MKVVKVGAVWCSACLVMKPRWQEVERENPWLKTKYLDFDEDKKKIKKYGLSKDRLPTFIFLDKKGKELERIRGEISRKKIVELIYKYEI